VRAQFWAAHRSELLRAGLGVLAAIDTLIGGWALVLPGSLYRDFPGFGMHWVAAAPPYNEHHLLLHAGLSRRSNSPLCSVLPPYGDERDTARRGP
jgi:hypothetical protein